MQAPEYLYNDIYILINLGLHMHHDLYTIAWNLQDICTRIKKNTYVINEVINSTWQSHASMISKQITNCIGQHPVYKIRHTQVVPVCVWNNSEWFKSPRNTVAGNIPQPEYSITKIKTMKHGLSEITKKFSGTSSMP